MGTFNRNATRFAMLSLLASLSSCNDTAFVGSNGGLSQFNPENCKVGTTTRPIRVIFMIDNSGSTNTTDPSKAIRVATLRKFIADYGSNTYLSYNFGYFSGTTANQYNMVANTFSVNTAANPVGDAAGLTSALNAYDALTSSGNTPYKAAFDSMAATVAADEAAGNKQDYAVVFMSDGQPTDISGTTNLNALVTSLKSTAGGNGSLLTVSTVYFGDSTDTVSIGNLQSMATAGSGRFINTNTNGTVVINDLLVVPGACTL